MIRISLIVAILLVIVLSTNTVKAEETKLYYFCTKNCKIQTTMIRLLKTRGFNFEIIKDDKEKFKDFNVTVFPTILIITGDTTIRLEGYQPLRKLIKVLKNGKEEEMDQGCYQAQRCLN